MLFPHKRNSFVITTLLLSLLLVTIVSAQTTTTSPTSNTTSNTVPFDIFAPNLAPFPVKDANITISRSDFSTETISDDKSHGVVLVVQLHINNNNNSNSSSSSLQWNRATAQFAKFLAFSSSSIADSVFAPSRHLEKAPWSVEVSNSDLTLRLRVGSCIDMPHRGTKEGKSALNLDIQIPPSLTYPPLSAALPMSQQATFLPQETSASNLREILGVVFFVILFLMVVIILKSDCGSAALELFWTIQVMLMVSDSPCSKHSFFSFSTFVFWMLRWSIEPRSKIPAIIHTVVMLLGMAISFCIGHKAKTPQMRLLHPRLGMFFVSILLLGGVFSSMSLLIGGLDDKEATGSTDTGNRGVGILLLLINIISSLIFVWTGTGSFSLHSLTVQPAVLSSSKNSNNNNNDHEKSSFFIRSVWKPISLWKRNSPIIGIYSNIAYLPPKLNNLSNFLPFFLSFSLNLVTALFLSVDPNNIGGCIGTISTCIFLSLIYLAYVSAGSAVCRSAAWTTFVSLCYGARVMWFLAALVHLDCHREATTTNSISTALAMIAIAIALAAGILGIICAKKEQGSLLSNKMKGKSGNMDVDSSRSLKPLQDVVKGGLKDLAALPQISISKVGNQIGNLIGRRNSQIHDDDDALLGHQQNPLLQSQQSFITMVENDGTPSKKKFRKSLPPISDGTGEKPQSPLFGGIDSTAAVSFDPASSPLFNAGLVNSSVSRNGGSPNGGANAYPVLSLRDRFLNMDESANSGNNNNKSSNNNNLFVANQRPRGESTESRLSGITLSSGSGGHSGPGSSKQRSPSDSFGKSAPPQYCPRCGAPVRGSGPAGMRQLCPSCKREMASPALAGVNHHWDFPSTTNGADSFISPSNMNQRNHHSGTEMVSMPRDSNNNRTNNNNNNVFLPSWGVSGGAASTSSGIVTLPSYQPRDDGDDADWL